jgi:pyruvate/2-oxoglutarate dehydrogenase complex dihydrolipoamide dehydrogenase (E3) component
MIRESRRVHEARSAAALGLPASQPADVDFAAAMARMRARRARIAEEDAAARYRDELGVDVFLGPGRFAGDDVVAVGDARLRFRRAVIATGARAATPPIEGLAEAGYLTNETVFTLTERPRRLAVIGAGPIGCELAQAFGRLGCRVVLIEKSRQVMGREDPDAAAVVQRALERDGVRVMLGADVRSVRVADGEKRLRVAGDARDEEVAADAVLVGVGRTPNVEGLDLEAVGVRHDAGGVEVDDFLRTTNRRIFAAGDVCMRWKFTHAADAAAKIVVQNALFPFVPRPWKPRLSKLVMPWCTYTDPEVAHVGWSAREAEAHGVAVDTIHVPLERTNRAVLDGETEGFARIHLARGRDRIVGATVVAAHAGEMVSELTLAMVTGAGLRTLLGVIHPYPTQSEVIKRAAGEHARSRLTPAVAAILGRLMAWQR